MDSFQKQKSKLPSLAQWKQLYRVLNSKERIILPILVVLFLFSLFSSVHGVYFKDATIEPVQGGTLIEGIVGSPRFLNPLYADINDADRDVIQLLYSGILRYDNQGNLVPDLAAAMPEVTEGGRSITVSLKEHIQWHDGSPFTADDIIFTIAAIKDPASKSPIRANWIGVDVEKVSDYTVRFHILDPYAPFFERLTLKILPMHLWSEISSENLALTPLNMQPIGTGPYTLKKINQNRSGLVYELQLEAYENYHNKKPFIQSVLFRFFQDENSLIAEANRGAIQSFSLHTVQNIQKMRNPAFHLYAFPIPRYFALFFNLNPPANQPELKNTDIRHALNLALDKKQLIDAVFQETAHVIESPFFPEIFNFSKPDISETPNQQQALALLEQQGYTKNQGKIGKINLSDQALAQDLLQGDEGEDVRKLQECLAKDPEVYPDGVINGSFGNLTKGAVIRFQNKYASEVLAPLGLTQGTGKAGELTRTKLNTLCFAGTSNSTPLTITVTTINQSPLQDVARELEKQWEAFGLQVEIQTFPATELEREIIKPRAYQSLLFGEVLGKIPDPFPFWHSSQIQTPGLNLSSYENKSLDTLLESLRKESDETARATMLEGMQSLMLKDTPALFLYDFDHHYFVTTDVQGIQTPVLVDPAQRFAGITEWFIKTKKIRN